MRKKMILILPSSMIGSELHKLVNTATFEVIESVKIEEKDPFDEFNRLTKELKSNEKTNNKHPFDKFINGGKKKKR